jgi:transposase-like protein
MGSTKKGGRRERRAFSAEFKAEAVRMLAERRAVGASVAQIGRELAVRPDLLRVWAKERPAAVQSGGRCRARRWSRRTGGCGASSRPCSRSRRS